MTKAQTLKQQITFKEILKEVRAVKPRITERQVRRYMAEAQVRHLGCRQRPQRYSAQAPAVIFRHLGISIKAGGAK